MDIKSEKLFLEGYNCAQSVFAAYSDKFGISEDTALKLSAPLGGGIGRMREVCGAFSACAMLCGLKFADSSSDPQSKEKIYELTQKLAAEFKSRNGSIICRELLKLQDGGVVSPHPDERNEKYYAQRPCLKIIETASDIIEKNILSSK